MAVGYFKQVFVAADQVINALLGGYADETYSSRCYRESQTMTKLIDTLLFFDGDHCHMSYISEQLRLQMPPELRL